MGSNPLGAHPVSEAEREYAHDLVAGVERSVRRSASMSKLNTFYDVPAAEAQGAEKVGARDAEKEKVGAKMMRKCRSVEDWKARKVMRPLSMIGEVAE